MSGVEVVEMDAPSEDVAALSQAVSAVLWLWDSVGLELGEVALVTDGHRWSRLAAVVATWYGAIPILFITATPGEVAPGVTAVASTGSEKEARDLAAMVRGRPGIAAAELSGTAAMVDLLLEALPRGSRVIIAGNAREPLTIDYYLNVHIKGVSLTSGILDATPSDAAIDVRAQRLLAQPAFSAACRTALALG
jgi:hypothetical protein